MTTGEPILIRYYSINAQFTLAVVRRMWFDKCTTTCIHHDSVTQSTPHPKSPRTPTTRPSFLQSLTTTELFPNVFILSPCVTMCLPFVLMGSYLVYSRSSVHIC